jgi:beta-phosphoglucomutase-like phosphatase (HAD superfamily)
VTEREFDWDLKKRLLGLRGPEWSRIVVDELRLDGLITPEELVRQWEENLNNLCESIEEMDGADYITSELLERRIPMAIATSSSFNSVQKKKLKHSKIFDRMQLVICGDNKDVLRGKPHPDIYLLTAKQLGVDPSRCLVFEDAMTGVQAARSAGMNVVAIPDPKLDLSMFLNETPFVIDSLKMFNWDDWDFCPKL